jgi:mannose-1-phosphate guanylyltransferase
MKAFLLAAGLGTRLRPLTDALPKCMVPIGDRPLLDIWLDSLADAGVDEALINVHHLPDVVRDHVGGRNGPPVAHTVYEERLLGSAGTLVANTDWLVGEELVLVCNADNLTDFDLRSLVAAHRRWAPIATVAVFHAERPTECGIVDVDATGRMTGFSEKPPNPRGDLANAGMYAFDPRVVDEIEGPPPKDIGYDLLPRLVGRARTVEVGGYFRDIGTPEALHRAQHEWSSRGRT